MTTEFLILATIVIWIVYDVYIYFKKGNAWTESSTFQKWATRAPGIALLLGILAGHFVFPIHGLTALPTDPEGNLIYQAGADIKAGQYLLPDQNGLLFPKK